jgi:hypothetical protein
MNLGILRILGIFLFVYLTWRNLKEDYEEDKLVTYSWVALLGFLVVGRVTYGLVNFGVWNHWIDWFSVWNKPGMDYVSGFLAIILVNFLFSKLNNWKFWPFCEDSLNGILIFLGFLLGDEFLRTKFDLQVGVYLLLIVLMIFFLKLAGNKYRALVWYKSGKKGFAFLATVFLGFLALGLITFYFKVNLIYSIIYWVVSLLSIVRLCILGEVF